LVSILSEAGCRPEDREKRCTQKTGFREGIHSDFSFL
jgi:hypothetical protein